ncbi:MAG: hypothetical protein NC343_08370 [Muribaculum sp.]|nr:hypothetical protein [Muribaculaceae bacterium]MCM1081752.1 hypothetical protein [Muribaculum sp.]
MNTENRNLEEIRSAWNALGKKLNDNAGLGNNTSNMNNRKTTLDRLREKYRSFWIFALVMLVVTIFYSPIIVSEERILYMRLLFSIYFIAVFTIDYWLWRGLGTIDLISMTVTEVAHKVMFYKRRHLQFMAFLIPMAVILVILMGYILSADGYMLTGIIIGAICGALIGTWQFRKFMSMYRNIEE